MTLDGEELIDALAYRDLYRSVPETVRSRLGLEALTIGGGTVLVAPGLDHMLFNRAIDVPTEHLDEAVAAFEARGIGRYLLQVGAEEEEAVARWGVERGIEQRRAWGVLARDRGPVGLARTELRILDAQPRHAERIGQLLCEGFQFPAAAGVLFEKLVIRQRWWCSVGCDQGAVVAAGLLFVHHRVGYLFAAATTPSHRRLGAQAALLSRRLQQAFRAGVERAYSETGEPQPGTDNPSWNNMVRAGFRPVGRRVNFSPAGLGFAAGPARTQGA